MVIRSPQVDPEFIALERLFATKDADDDPITGVAS